MKSVVLIVLDGYGIAPPGPGNAVYLANPTTITSFTYTFPNTTLRASGDAVGLPAEEVGNTEVGHISLGAGRIVYQDLTRINLSIADGSFYKNEVFVNAIDHVKKNPGSKLHLLGLVAEGSVHSNINHLYALLYLAKESGIHDVLVHAITDGRDSPPKAAASTIQQVEEKMSQLGVGKIATVMGRYYAMDRDQRWDRVEKAYLCYTEGVGNKAASAAEAIQTAYKNDKTDEFIEPTVISKDNELPLIKDNDTIIFFNFRIDRPREITKAFVLDQFDKEHVFVKSFDPYEVKYSKSHIRQPDTAAPFIRKKKLQNIYFATMTEYEKQLPVSVAFPPNPVQTPLAKVISEKGLKQLHMSESEKERFVTFYFNGQREEAFPNEDRTIIPSPKVATYDLKPEMSAPEVCEELIKQMKTNKYNFILVNFANADMVGHTGNIEATIKAVQTLDSCLAKIYETAKELNYTLCITADHGNAEQKINPTTGDISTEHTANPVPFIVVDKEFEGRPGHLQPGILADVAPTILNLMQVEKPSSMTGRDLLEEE
jgi:2,3-bisphosphoglycerate-independent phosphoglycerate mutase